MQSVGAYCRSFYAVLAAFFTLSAEAAPSEKTFTTVPHPGAYPTPQNVVAALSDDGRRIVLQWDGVRWPVDGYPGVIDGRDVPTNFYYAVDCRTRASGAAEWDSWWNCSSLSRFASNYGVPGPFLDRVTLTRNAGPGTNYQFRVRCQCNAVWRGEGLYPTPNEDPDPTQDAYFSDWSETVQAYRTLDALALSLVEDAAPTPQGGKTTVEVAYTYTSSRADDGEEPLFFTFEAIEIPDDGWHPEAPAEGQKPYVRRDGTPLAVKTLHVRPPDAAQAVDPTNFTLTASSAAGETRRIRWSAWRDLENYCHTNVTIRVQGWAKPEAAGAAPRRVLDEAIGNVGLDTRLPPQNVVASTNDTNAVTVVWDAVPDATGYEVTVESWGVAASHAERMVTTNEACLVDRELPLPGLGRYTVRAVYPNGLKGAASAAAVGWRALDKAEVTGLATRRPWDGTVDIDLAFRTVRGKYAQAVDGASALPEKTVTVAVTTADGAAFAVQSLVRERLDAFAGIIRREPVTNGSFTLGANDRIVWDARSDAPRMREPGAVLKVTLAGDAYGGPIVIERTFDLDTRTGLIDLPFGAENIRIPWSTRWAKPEVKEGGLGFGENDAWWKQTAVLTDVTDSANHVEILRTEAKLGECTVCTWTPKNWGVNTLTLTLSPVSGSNERTEYAAVFRMPDFAFKVRAADEDGVTLRWRALDGAASYEIRRRLAGGTSGDFETVTNVTDATTWTDSSVDTIVGSFEYVVVPKTASGGGSLPVLSPVTGTRGAPQTPQNVVASTNDTNAVTVVWDAVPKASGYEVKVESWDVAINRTERTVTVTETCFVDTELPQPGLGRYTVTAVYPNGVKGEPSAPAVGHAALDTMKILGASTRWPWNGTVDLDVEYKTVRPRFRELFGMDNLPYPTNVTLAATTADGAPIAVRTLVKESPLDTGTYTVNRAEVPNGAQDPGGTMIFRGSGRTRLVWDAEADAPDRAAPGATLTLTVSDDRCRTTDSCRIDLDTTKPRAIPLAEEVAEISLPWAARWADETSASLNMQDGSDVKVVAITRYNAVTNVVNTLTMLADEGGMLTNRIDYGVTVLECTISNRATGAQTTYTRQFIRAPVIPATAVRRPGENAIDVMWTVVDGCTYYQVVRRTVDRDGTRGAWGNRMGVSPSGAEGCYPDIGVDALTLYEFAVCPKYADPSDYGYVTAEPVVPSAPVSVLGARLDLYNLSVGDPWDCTVGVDFAYASCRLLSDPTDLAHVSLKDLTGGTNVSARTLALDGASVSNALFTLDLDPAQGAVSTGRLAWHATADLPNAYLTNVVLEVKMQQSGTTAVTAPFTLDTRGTHATFDALGPWLDGGATAVTQTVAAVYGALPAATRAGGRLVGWFLGVTNGAPQALEGEAPLRLEPHTLYARWAADVGVTASRDTRDGAIDVSWRAADGVAGYDVLRRQANRDGTKGEWTVCASLGADVTAYRDADVDMVSVYEYAIRLCDWNPDAPGETFQSAPSSAASGWVHGATLALSGLAVGDPWDCTVGVDFAYASGQPLGGAADDATVFVKDLDGGTNLVVRTLTRDGASVSNGAFTLDLDPAQGAVSTGRLAWNATADVPNVLLPNVVLVVQTSETGAEAKTEPFTLDTYDTRAVFDALGPWLDGGETVVTQRVADVYGALPAATRTGYRLAGWFIGVTNGAPQALEGEAPLRLGPHTLYARWETDWGGETAFAYEAIDATTARITGLKGAAPANGRFGLPDRVDGYLVTEIGARAFQNGTDDFGAVALGVFCTNVADYAFCGATKLTGLAFAAPRRAAAPSESATLALGDYAFASTGLTRVVIPACVSHLGAGAFGSCRALDEVSVLGTPALGADNVFRRAGIDTPDGKMTLRAAPAWISANGLDAKGNLVPAALTPAVESVRATAISGAGRVWTLTFDVRLAAGGDWAAFDAHTMRLEYAPSPSGAWAALVPAALDARAAGVVKLTVVLPEEKPSGFFRVVFGE